MKNIKDKNSTRQIIMRGDFGNGILKKTQAYILVLFLIFLGGLPSAAWSASIVFPVTQWLLIGTFHTADESEKLDFPYLPEPDLASQAIPNMKVSVLMFFGNCWDTCIGIQQIGMRFLTVPRQANISICYRRSGEVMQQFRN